MEDKNVKPRGYRRRGKSSRWPSRRTLISIAGASLLGVGALSAWQLEIKPSHVIDVLLNWGKASNEVVSSNKQDTSNPSLAQKPTTGVQNKSGSSSPSNGIEVSPSGSFKVTTKDQKKYSKGEIKLLTHSNGGESLFTLVCGYDEKGKPINASANIHDKKEKKGYLFSAQRFVAYNGLEANVLKNDSKTGKWIIGTSKIDYDGSSEKWQKKTHSPDKKIPFNPGMFLGSGKITPEALHSGHFTKALNACSLIALNFPKNVPITKLTTTQFVEAAEQAVELNSDGIAEIGNVFSRVSEEVKLNKKVDGPVMKGGERASANVTKSAKVTKDKTPDKKVFVETFLGRIEHNTLQEGEKYSLMTIHLERSYSSKGKDDEIQGESIDCIINTQNKSLVGRSYQQTTKLDAYPETTFVNHAIYKEVWDNCSVMVNNKDKVIYSGSCEGHVEKGDDYYLALKYATQPGVLKVCVMAQDMYYKGITNPERLAEKVLTTREGANNLGSFRRIDYRAPQ